MLLQIGQRREHRRLPGREHHAEAIPYSVVSDNELDSRPLDEIIVDRLSLGSPCVSRIARRPRAGPSTDDPSVWGCNPGSANGERDTGDLSLLREPLLKQSRSVLLRSLFGFKLSNNGSQSVELEDLMEPRHRVVGRLDTGVPAQLLRQPTNREFERRVIRGDS